MMRMLARGTLCKLYPSTTPVYSGQALPLTAAPGHRPGELSLAFQIQDNRRGYAAGMPVLHGVPGLIHAQFPQHIHL